MCKIIYCRNSVRFYHALKLSRPCKKCIPFILPYTMEAQVLLTVHSWGVLIAVAAAPWRASSLGCGLWTVKTTWWLGGMYMALGFVLSHIEACLRWHSSAGNASGLMLCEAGGCQLSASGRGRPELTLLTLWPAPCSPAVPCALLLVTRVAEDTELCLWRPPQPAVEVKWVGGRGAATGEVSWVLLSCLLQHSQVLLLHLLSPFFSWLASLSIPLG